jgi:hypothetical protein
MSSISNLLKHAAHTIEDTTEETLQQDPTEGEVVRKHERSDSTIYRNEDNETHRNQQLKQAEKTRSPRTQSENHNENHQK